jgi:hypothetical protein
MTDCERLALTESLPGVFIHRITPYTLLGTVRTIQPGLGGDQCRPNYFFSMSAQLVIIYQAGLLPLLLRFVMFFLETGLAEPE